MLVFLIFKILSSHFTNKRWPKGWKWNGDYEKLYAEAAGKFGYELDKKLDKSIFEFASGVRIQFFIIAIAVSNILLVTLLATTKRFGQKVRSLVKASKNY